MDTHTGRSHEKSTIKMSVSHAKIPGTISKKRFMTLVTLAEIPILFYYSIIADGPMARQSIRVRGMASSSNG